MSPLAVRKLDNKLKAGNLENSFKLLEEQLKQIKIINEKTEREIEGLRIDNENKIIKILTYLPIHSETVQKYLCQNTTKTKYLPKKNVKKCGLIILIKDCYGYMEKK